MNFNERTNQLVALIKAKEEAWIRYRHTEALQHRAYFEYPHDSAVCDFVRRATAEAHKAYEAAAAAYDAVSNGGFDVTDSAPQPDTAPGSVTSDWRQQIVETEILRDGAVYTAKNGWFVKSSGGHAWFDWYVYRDDGCLFTFAVTLEAAKKLADEGRERGVR